MLLKETADKRHQLESLIDANKALQSKLDRYAAESDAVQASLSAAAEKHASLAVEQCVLLAFAETRVREMGFRFDAIVAERNDMARVVSERENDVVVLEHELSELTLRAVNERVMLCRVSEERDNMRSELDGAIGEAERLREKVLEAEERERRVRKEVEKLRLERESLLEEGNEREREIEELKKERDLAVRSREESDGVVEKLKEEIDGVVRERNEIEKLKNDYEWRIVGLELETKELNESLKNLRSKEAVMRERIRELEGRLGAAMEKGEGMEMEVRALVREKEEMEKSVEALTERRDGVEKVLDMVQKDLEDKQREIDEVIRVRDEIEQAKAQREDEIAEMQREVDRLRDVVEKLKESCREFEEKNKQLITEVEHYRGSFEGVVLEKDNIGKAFDEEKSKVENFMLQVAGMEERIEQTAAELDRVRTEREKLIERNKMMESHVGVLVNEKDVLQRSLMEAQRERDDLRAKIEFSCVNSNMALAMLKNTAALVCQKKDVVEEVVSNGKKLEEDVQPFAEELDAIRKAFKSKDEMVDDMKQQLESLHKSVAEAHKNKSLWTVISSATTIFAAALAAYAARGR